MTPQERRLIDDLFDRLAGLENSPRDPEAERAIIDGLRRAPNAAYALVQTALVQDEVLKRANAHIEELESHVQASSGSFLDSMRDTVSGQSQQRGSVPNIRPSDTGSPQRPVWNSGQVLNSDHVLNDGPAMNSGYADPRSAGYSPAPGYPGAGPGSSGGSFLGTAAAAAAGMIGGSLLMNSIRGLTGGGNHQAFGDTNSFGSQNPDSRSPWAGDQSGSELARDAGVNDIGRGNLDGNNLGGNDDRHQGLFDSASNDGPGGDDDGFDSGDFGSGSDDV